MQERQYYRIARTNTDYEKSKITEGKFICLSGIPENPDDDLPLINLEITEVDIEDVRSGKILFVNDQSYFIINAGKKRPEIHRFELTTRRYYNTNSVLKEKISLHTLTTICNVLGWDPLDVVIENEIWYNVLNGDPDEPILKTYIRKVSE